MKFDSFFSNFNWSPIVIVLKRNSVDLNYYQDDYIKYFAPKAHTHPIFSFFHYIRVVSNRKIFDKFFQYFKDQKVQFVNIGCGLDTASLWVFDNFKNAVCFDLDLEFQVKLKVDVLTKTKELMRLFPDHEATEHTFKSPRYNLFPCDLKKVDQLDKLKEYGFSNELPTVFLTEFVLTYLENHYSDKVINKLSKMTNGPTIHIYFEFIQPSTTFAQWFFPYVQQHKASMYSFRDYPTFETQTARFKSLGWEDFIPRYLSFVYNSLIDKEERKRLRNIETFNDMPSLSTYCNHLILAVAYNNLKDYPQFLEIFKESKMDKNDPEDELMEDFSTTYFDKDFDLKVIEKYVVDMMDENVYLSTNEQKSFYEKFK